MFTAYDTLKVLPVSPSHTIVRIYKMQIISIISIIVQQPIAVTVILLMVRTK